MPVTLDKESSQRIAILRFPLIVGVVFIHNAETTLVRYAHNSIGMKSSSIVVTYIQNLISNGIADTAVPLFFLISGYLFFSKFHSVKQDYIRQLKSRLHTLLIPFLIWNIATLLFFVIAQSLPMTQEYFTGRHASIIGLDFYGYINAIFGTNGYPISYQFWFIRDLMFLVLMSPLINFFIERFCSLYIAFIAIFTYISIFTYIQSWPNFALAIEALLFFSVGSAFAIKGKSLFLFDDRTITILAAYFIALIFDAFTFNNVWHQYLHQISIVLGILSILGLSKMAVYHNKTNEWLLGISNASFFVFAAHEPLLTIIKKISYIIIQPSSSFSVIALYFLVPVVLIFFLVGIYRISSKHFPWFTRVVTGGR